ncbi:hypothetical protein Poly59_53300 [Rubripirellula reticaptiva]|uniref:Uncharacterized protein n=1 Tax=Rubripirellula reticaptiva TaxID=2528013 RepID=A0A5C6EBX1_9BACT|nr:hypothetical protein Poly59_53300 [Rubripirellula reticaptiva]
MNSAKRMSLVLVIAFGVSRLARQDANNLHIDALGIAAAYGIGWLMDRVERNRESQDSGVGDDRCGRF